MIDRESHVRSLARVRNRWRGTAKKYAEHALFIPILIPTPILFDSQPQFDPPPDLSFRIGFGFGVGVGLIKCDKVRGELRRSSDDFQPQTQTQADPIRFGP